MKFVWDGHRWVEAAVAKAMRGHHEHGPGIVSDFAEPLLCHADGRYHGSRTTYDAAVRAAGCEVVGKSEMQRMQAREFRPRDTREPVAATMRRIINQHGG